MFGDEAEARQHPSTMLSPYQSEVSIRAVDEGTRPAADEGVGVAIEGIARPGAVPEAEGDLLAVKR